MSFAILRTAKLKSWGEIGGSLSHNYRTRETLNADSDRSHLNEHSHKDTQSVKNDINSRLPEKRRSDAVLCIEHLITASPEWSGWGTSKEKEFFDRSLGHLKALYGFENVIAHSIHRDESTPHLVVYVVPLDITGRLNCKKWLGGKKLLSQMQTNFANEVKNLGLERGLEGSTAEHKSIKQYYSEVNDALRDPNIVQPAVVEPKLFEMSKTYGERVANDVFQQLEPRFKQFEAVVTELSFVKKQNVEIRKTLKDAEQYLHVIHPLSAENRQKLNEIIETEGKKIYLNQEAEKQKQKALKDKFKKFDKKSGHEKDQLEKELIHFSLECEDKKKHKKQFENEYELLINWNNEKRQILEEKKEQEERHKQWEIGYQQHLESEKQKQKDEAELIKKNELEYQQRVEKSRADKAKVNKEIEENRRQQSVINREKNNNRNNDFEM